MNKEGINTKIQSHIYKTNGFYVKTVKRMASELDTRTSCASFG